MVYLRADRPPPTRGMRPSLTTAHCDSVVSGLWTMAVCTLRQASEGTILLVAVVSSGWNVVNRCRCAGIAFTRARCKKHSDTESWRCSDKPPQSVPVHVSRKCVEHYSVNIVQADRRAIVRSVRLGDRSIDFCTQAAEEISVRALARGRKQMKRARGGAPALQRIGSPAG